MFINYCRSFKISINTITFPCYHTFHPACASDQPQGGERTKMEDLLMTESESGLLSDDAAETYEIPVEKVAVSFSDDSRRKMLKPPEKATANKKVE